MLFMFVILGDSYMRSFWVDVNLFSLFLLFLLFVDICIAVWYPFIKSGSDGTQLSDLSSPWFRLRFQCVVLFLCSVILSERWLFVFIFVSWFVDHRCLKLVLHITTWRNSLNLLFEISKTIKTKHVMNVPCITLKATKLACLFFLCLF